MNRLLIPLLLMSIGCTSKEQYLLHVEIAPPTDYTGVHMRLSVTGMDWNAKYADISTSSTTSLQFTCQIIDPELRIAGWCNVDSEQFVICDLEDVDIWVTDLYGNDRLPIEITTDENSVGDCYYVVSIPPADDG